MLKLPSSVLLIILGSLFLGLMMASSMVGTAWGAYGVTEREAIERGCDLEVLYKGEDNPLAGAGIGSEWAPMTGFPETPTVAEGTVDSVTLATVDAPHSHRSHDLLFNLDLDDTYRSLLVNYDRDEPRPPMHMEWESKYIPYLFWPMVDDRAWMMGRWVVDCGHVSRSAGLLKTEIHPPSAVAFIRDEPVFFDDLPSLGSKTYIYLSGDGGYYDAPNFGSNMEFDIQLPPRPSKYAHLETNLDVIIGEAESLSISPASIPSITERETCIGPTPYVTCEKKPTPNICPVGVQVDTCKIHVVLPFGGRPTNAAGGFASGEAWGAILSAGWVERSDKGERITTVGFRELEVIFDDIDIEWSHDFIGNLTERFGGGGDDGEWKLWANANGKWIRMSDQGVGMADTPEFPAASRDGAYLGLVADDDYEYLGWGVRVVVPETTGRLVIETTGWEADWMDDAISDGSLPEVLDANDYIGIICAEYGAAENFGIGGHKWIASVDEDTCTWSGTDDTPANDFSLGIAISEVRRWLPVDVLPPIADAGPDRTVCVGERVTLDGSRSYDSEGEPLSYSWKQLSGPKAYIDPTKSVTTFTAPTRTTALGFDRATFELTVTTLAQKTGNSDTDIVTITIKPQTTCTLPEIKQPPLFGNPLIGEIIR